MRIGLSGAAHLLRTTPSTVHNWTKSPSFPKPIYRAEIYREWTPEEIEAWATANWNGKPALLPWAIEKGYAKPKIKASPGGIPGDQWDTAALLRKADISRHLGLKQASGGRVFGRRDFPTATAGSPPRWNAADVLTWAREHADLKSLADWVDSAKNKTPEFKGYVIHDLSGLLGLSTRAVFGLMDRDATFPLEVLPGGWDRAEVDSWKAQYFDSPEYPHKRG